MSNIDPLPPLEDALDALRPAYGPAVISPPDTRLAPVAILLPQQIRYCVTCHHLRGQEDMRDNEHCKFCLS